MPRLLFGAFLLAIVALLVGGFLIAAQSGLDAKIQKIEPEAAYYRGVYESCLVVTWHKGAMDKSYCEMVVESAKAADAFNDILPENFNSEGDVDG